MKLRLELNSNSKLPQYQAHGHMHINSGTDDKGKTADKGILVHKDNNTGHAIFKGEQNFNNQINTTTNMFSGRVSFSGAPEHKVINAIVKNKWFASFCDLAQKNSAVAEAVGALFITCGMRPLAIMAMPQKDVDKNRKAASHSIASGITGLVFAKIAYEPFSAAMKKIQQAIKEGKESKYLGENAKYLLEKGVERTKNGIVKNISNMDCFNQLVTYGPKVLTASILAAFTVGTMPYIDKYIIDKYILKKLPNANDKPIFTTYDHFKFVTFKNTPQQEIFQNFKGALK